MMNLFRITGGALIAAIGLSGAAFSQTSTSRVDASSDWAVFVETNPSKMCWVVSSPTKTEISNKNAKRGEIQLLVTYRPGSATPEVSFTGGYPFKPDSTIKMQIGSDVFTLYPDGEWAWPAPNGDDAKVRDAMKAGATALLSGESSRGTTTKDTFSLTGFTAALQAAQKNCT
jgi:hypothetical protein